jgi:tetratricopeptide (TPR) repeat protein
MDEQLIRQILKSTKRVQRDRYAKVYAPLGDGLRRVGLLDDAVAACRTGLEIFPRYLACRETLGKIYLRQNKLADARRELEKVHEVIGENVELRKSLAKVYAKSNDRRRALELLDWLVIQDPFDFEMSNLRSQIRRDLEHEAARAAAVARGENPDTVDIYNLAKRPSVVDIKRIIDELPDLEYDNARAREATDEALDGLERIESVIDAEADRLVQAADDKAGAARGEARAEQVSARQREIMAESVEEISAAAVIAQVELEISLLDESLLACQRLQEQMPDDPDLADLVARFERRLEEKEAEMERLENIHLAHGL